MVKIERWPAEVLKKQRPVQKADKKIHFYNCVVGSSIIQICKKNTEGELELSLMKANWDFQEKVIPEGILKESVNFTQEIELNTMALKWSFEPLTFYGSSRAHHLHEHNQELSNKNQKHSNHIWFSPFLFPYIFFSSNIQSVFSDLGTLLNNKDMKIN